MRRILDGRRALVTGAASGIGRAVALAFAAEGARVAVVDRAPLEKIDAVVAEIGTAVSRTAEVNSRPPRKAGFPGFSGPFRGQRDCPDRAC